jgi:phytoene synthase
MDSDLIHALLPIEQRLSLVYATGSARDRLLGLLAFDSRCAAIVRSAREPLLGQMQLAWWREQLARVPQTRPVGEPLLGHLQCWRGEEGALVALAEGWELLLDAPPLPQSAIARFADARAEAWVAMARLAGCREQAAQVVRGARNWALADLAARVAHPDEREAAQALIARQDWSALRLPRALRPLVVLHGLARRSGGARPLLDGGGAFALAVRLGLFGR